MRWVPVAGSVAVHAGLLALLVGLGHHELAPPAPAPLEITLVDVAVLSAPPATASAAPRPGGGGAGDAATAPAAPDAHAAPHALAPAYVARDPDRVTRDPDAVPATRARPDRGSPWDDVAIHVEDDAPLGRDRDDRGGPSGNAGGGTGGGTGGGHGRGIGLGDGGGIDPIAGLPAPPAPPPPSRARPARLLHPARQTEVDRAELFVAMVTVDADGDVVGARMLQSHPGSRGETAESMIWQFRYAPALDDAGNPVRSTFEQPFAVR
jgi:hypothetical protein